MKKKLIQFLIIAIAVFYSPGLLAKDVGIGIRAGVGTDITLGLAYGGGINYYLGMPFNGLELGIQAYGHHSVETTNNGYNDYTDTTDLQAVVLLANYLIHYKPNEAGFFAVTGIGLGVIHLTFVETSPTDISLGTLLPGGGSSMSFDGTVGGSVFNLGFGYNFKNNIDLRLEVPFMVLFSKPGSMSSVVFAGTFTMGYRF